MRAERTSYARLPFENFTHLPNQELARFLTERFQQAHKRELDPSDADDVRLLLSQDEDRVWWRDTEDDVLPGNDAG